jgi:hypothetical protein
MNHSNSDAGIPVLTEVLADRLPPASAKAASIPASTPQAPQPVSPTTREIERFAEMEDELVKRVLQGVLIRLDPMIEERVRNTLADVLQTAVDDVAAKIRRGLREALQNVVIEATTEEMKRFRNQK